MSDPIQSPPTSQRVIACVAAAVILGMALMAAACNSALAGQESGRELPGAKVLDEADLDVRVVRTIAAPTVQVRSVLQDLEQLGSWFPAVAEWRILERAADRARVYGRQALPWPVRDRDYVVEYRWWDEPTGAFVLQATALADADPPPPSGVVRVKTMQTTWRISPAGRETLAQYHYLGSSGLPLPAWVAEIVAQVGWESQTHRVIDALADEVARRYAQPSRPMMVD